MSFKVSALNQAIRSSTTFSTFNHQLDLLESGTIKSIALYHTMADNLTAGTSAGQPIASEQSNVMDPHTNPVEQPTVIDYTTEQPTVIGHTTAAEQTTVIQHHTTMVEQTTVAETTSTTHRSTTAAPSASTHQSTTAHQPPATHQPTPTRQSTEAASTHQPSSALQRPSTNQQPAEENLPNAPPPYTELRAHTAKCESCDLKNKGIGWQCTKCIVKFCQVCVDRHGYEGLRRWHPPCFKSEEGTKTRRRRKRVRDSTDEGQEGASAGKRKQAEQPAEAPPSKSPKIEHSNVPGEGSGIYFPSTETSPPLTKRARDAIEGQNSTDADFSIEEIESLGQERPSKIPKFTSLDQPGSIFSASEEWQSFLAAQIEIEQARAEQERNRCSARRELGMQWRPRKAGWRSRLLDHDPLAEIAGCIQDRFGPEVTRGRVDRISGLEEAGNDNTSFEISENVSVKSEDDVRIKAEDESEPDGAEPRQVRNPETFAVVKSENESEPDGAEGRLVGNLKTFADVKSEQESDVEPEVESEAESEPVRAGGRRTGNVGAFSSARSDGDVSMTSEPERLDQRARPDVDSLHGFPQLPKGCTTIVVSAGITGLCMAYQLGKENNESGNYTTIMVLDYLRDQEGSDMMAGRLTACDEHAEQKIYETLARHSAKEWRKLCRPEDIASYVGYSRRPSEAPPSWLGIQDEGKARSGLMYGNANTLFVSAYSSKRNSTDNAQGSRSHDGLVEGRVP